MQCVVHYSHLSISSSATIVPLTESKHENLLENRAIRRDLGGANEHFEQCYTVPEILDTSIHGAHTVYYKKFTMAKPLKRRNVGWL